MVSVGVTIQNETRLPVGSVHIEVCVDKQKQQVNGNKQRNKVGISEASSKASLVAGP